jgi:predicted RecB family endonuclease
MKSAVDIFYNSVMDILPINEVNLRRTVTELYQINKEHEKATLDRIAFLERLSENFGKKEADLKLKITGLKDKENYGE